MVFCKNNRKGVCPMTAVLSTLYVKSMMAKEKVNKLLKSESGEANIIAIIIVIAIVVALAIVFRNNIKQLFDQIWSSIFGNVGSTTGTF